MINKIVTARKDYICDYCKEVIKKGSKYRFQTAKYPKYTWDEKSYMDIQTGISYEQCRTHAENDFDKCIDDFNKKYQSVGYVKDIMKKE